jgi:hypothetical protein
LFVAVYSNSQARSERVSAASVWAVGRSVLVEPGQDGAGVVELVLGINLGQQQLRDTEGDVPLEVFRHLVVAADQQGRARPSGVVETGPVDVVVDVGFG